MKSGVLALDAEGHGRTDDMTLPDGHYELFWNFEGEKGSGGWLVVRRRRAQQG